MIAMPADALNCDFYPQARVFDEVQIAPPYAANSLPGLVVTIDGSYIIVIDSPAGAYRMDHAERRAMEQAFWDSVVVIDDGRES